MCTNTPYKTQAMKIKEFEHPLICLPYLVYGRAGFYKQVSGWFFLLIFLFSLRFFYLLFPLGGNEVDVECIF